MPHVSVADEQPGRDSENAPDWLALFQGGDADAFRGLFEEFAPRLVGFFYRLCWDAQRSEDLTQDVFVKLYRSAPSYRPMGRLREYVFCVARNRWLDARKKAAPPDPATDRLDASGWGSSDAGPVTFVSPMSGAPEPLDVLVKKETESALRVGVQALPDAQRMAFALSEYEGFSYNGCSNAHLPELVPGRQVTLFRTMRVDTNRYSRESIMSCKWAF